MPDSSFPIFTPEKGTGSSTETLPIRVFVALAGASVFRSLPRTARPTTAHAFAPIAAGHDTTVSNRLAVRLAGARSVNRRGTHNGTEGACPLGHGGGRRPRGTAAAPLRVRQGLFFEGECRSTGEILQSDGSLLCADHAHLVRLERQEHTLLGKVFEMDKRLDEPNNRAEDLHWRRMLRERDETVKQLRSNRTLIEAHEGANRQR